MDSKEALNCIVNYWEICYNMRYLVVYLKMCGHPTPMVWRLAGGLGCRSLQTSRIILG